MKSWIEKFPGLDSNSPVPLYLQLYDNLKSYIGAEDRIDEFLPKEEDLCDLFGTSRQTVRKALEKLSSEGLITRIKRKGTLINSDFQKGNFHHRGSSKKRLGVLFPISDPWTPSLEAIGERARNVCGFEVTIRSYPWGNLVEEEKALEDLRQTCDGMILYPNRYGIDRELVANFAADGFPLVLFDVYLPGVEVGVVASDNFGGAYMASKHLIENGAKKLAVACGNLRSTSNLDRLRGYQKALMDSGIEYDPKLKCDFFAEWDDAREGGSDYNDELYSFVKKFIVENKPDALFATDYLFISTIFNVCTELNLDIPNDLMLVSFGIKLKGVFHPTSLTAAEQAKKELGEAAADLAAEMICGDTNFPKKKVLLGTNLVVRESSRRRKNS